MNAPLLRRALAFYLPVAALLTVTTVLVYGAVQHVYRSSANDPQLQIATDAANRLDAGASPQSVVGTFPVDLARSLAVHLTVFDRHGAVLASTARLDGAIPTPPRGTLDAVRGGGANLVTWQPRRGVRVAAVIIHWRGGAVLAGRSLTPSESRESDLEQLILAAWLGGLVVLAPFALAAAWLWSPDGTALPFKRARLRAS